MSNNPTSDDENIQRDIASMIDALKDNKIYGPYALSMIDENGELVEFLIDEDGNVESSDGT